MIVEELFPVDVKPVPINGHTYHVRPLTGAQVEALVKNEGEESIEGVRALSRVMCFCLCEEDGTRTFSDADVDKVREQAPFPLIRELGAAALKHSGVETEEGREEGNG